MDYARFSVSVRVRNRDSLGTVWVRVSDNVQMVWCKTEEIRRHSMKLQVQRSRFEACMEVFFKPTCCSALEQLVCGSYTNCFFV